MLKNFKEMAELVKANPVKKRIVLCCAHDEHSLDAVYEAFKEGIVEPVFVGKEDEIPQYNITVSAPIVIAGGSPDKPGITDLKLQIAAKEGTIPDIHGIKIGLEATSQTGCDGVPLQGTQGIFIQSSSAKISGGITIPLN